MAILTVLLWILAICLIVVGFVGVVAPALPGPAFVYAGIFLIAWADGFERIGFGVLILLGLLTALVVLVDYVAAAIGTKRYGGSRWGIGGAIVGALVGMFFLPFGLIVGPLVGAIAGELVAGKDSQEAARAGWGAFIGFLGGTLVKYLLCTVMVAVAVASYLF